MDDSGNTGADSTAKCFQQSRVINREQTAHCMLISHEVQLTAVKKYIFNVIVFNCHWLMQSQSGAKIFSQKCWVLIKKKKKKKRQPIPAPGSPVPNRDTGTSTGDTKNRPNARRVL